MKKKIIMASLMMMLCSLTASAQWAVGMSVGWDYNSPTIDKGYASDYSYTGKGGWDVGVIGRYQFKEWLAVRADLRLSSRCYQMNRHQMDFEQFYTKHRDTYLHLPVMADLSVGEKKLRGHLYLGGYMGSWLDAHRSGHTGGATSEMDFDESMDFDSRRDKRFNAGLIGGLGISYPVSAKWELMAECLYMYDLTKSNVTSSIVSNPRYNSTFMLNAGVMYNF